MAEEITDRGRVVAILAPPPRTEGLERLRQAGAVRPAKPGPLYEVIKELGTLPEIGLMDALQDSVTPTGEQEGIARGDLRRLVGVACAPRPE